MKTNQEGFSAVEAILIILIVGIISFAGWFVWNSQKQTSKTIDESNKSSSAATSTKKTTVSNATASSSTVQGTVNYVDVKDWGVKIPLSEGIKSISFKYDTSRTFFPGDVIVITSITDSSGKEFKPFVSNGVINEQNVDAICTTYGLGRSTNSSEINATTGLPYDQASHVGNYYYYNAHPSGGSCGQSDAATKATDATKAMFKNLTTE